MRFAQSAMSSEVETDRSVYPILTTSTDENSTVNQNRYVLTKRMHPIKSTSESTAAAPYMTERLPLLSPTALQPDKLSIHKSRKAVPA